MESLTIKAAHPFVLLWSEAVISNESIDLHYLEDRILFVCPGSHQLCAAAPGTCAQLLPSGWGWGVGYCYCAKSWNWPIISTVYHPCLPLEVASLQHTLKFQNSSIQTDSASEILPRRENRYLVLSTLQSFQNPFHREPVEEHSISHCGTDWVLWYKYSVLFDLV